MLHVCNDNLVDYICNKNIDDTCLGKAQLHPNEKGKSTFANNPKNYVQSQQWIYSVDKLAEITNCGIEFLISTPRKVTQYSCRLVLW